MIFIIDDDDATRDSLRLLFECMGLEARDFPSPETFLDGWKPAAEDCLVLDVHMAGMSGLDLLEKLRQKPFKPGEILGLVRQVLNERPRPGFHSAP